MSVSSTPVFAPVLAPLFGLALLLAAPGCKSGADDAGATKADAGNSAADGNDPSQDADTKTAAADTDPSAADTDPSAADTEPSADAGGPSAEFDRLVAWMPREPLSVVYDRLGQRLDAAVVTVVFAVPPMAGDLMIERETLDEGLDIVFDGDGEPENWLSQTSLAFTVALSKTPYFVRPLTRPAAEVVPFLDEAGFTKNTIDEVEVWLPGGSFPWRIALLDGDVAAFIPVDVPGAGLEPLTKPEDAAEPAAVVTELRGALTADPMIELVLVAAGPLVHFDVRQSIAQVQFALRKVPGPQSSYEGQIRLMPTGDPDECLGDLQGRAHPEENQQVQALMGQVQFAVAEGGVSGGLALAPDQLKHVLAR